MATRELPVRLLKVHNGSNGHLEVVQWLHGNRQEEGCTSDAMDWAAENGHLELVQWLHKNRQERMHLLRDGLGSDFTKIAQTV